MKRLIITKHKLYNAYNGKNKYYIFSLTIASVLIMIGFYGIRVRNPAN